MVKKLSSEDPSYMTKEYVIVPHYEIEEVQADVGPRINVVPDCTSYY